MKLSKVEELFHNRARIVGSVFLLRPQDAIELVLECKRRRILVFGAEAFYTVGDQIQPSMEHGISEIDPKIDRYEATITFLRSHMDSELWFEVMVDAPRV